MQRREDGFTIIELTLSTAFFSFVLMFAIYGFIQINRSYTRGITVREVQDRTRQSVDEISNAIRDARGSDITITNSQPYRLCTGNLRIGWNMSDTFGNFSGESYSDSSEPLGLVQTADGGNCTDPIAQDGAGETSDLLSEDMVVQHLEITPVGTSPAFRTDSFRIVLIISTDGRLNSDDFASFGVDAACDIKTGDQFCDVAKIETVVTARN